MNAIGEQALRWFSAESAVAEPDLTALVRGYSGLLYRVALSVLRNPAEAEDVVQDAFLRVLAAADSNSPPSSTSAPGWCASPGT